MRTRKKYIAEIISNDLYHWHLNSKQFKETLLRLKSLTDLGLDLYTSDFDSGYQGVKLHCSENEYIICFNSIVLHYDKKLISLKFDDCRSLENFLLSTIPQETPKHILKCIFNI